MPLTKTLPYNILSPDGNSFAVFLDINNPQVLKLKDINGNIDLMSNYLTPSGTFIVSIENVGTGAGIYIPNTTSPAQLKTIKEGSNVVITESAEEIQISVPNIITNQIGLYSQTAQSTPITNTTTPTSLINGGVGSLTVPANGFQVGSAFVAQFSGIISSLNNATIEIVISSNASILADTGVITLVSTNNKVWDLEIDFVIRSVGGAGVASIATAGRFNYNKNSNNLAESNSFFFVNNTTFDTTISNTLQVTLQWGSASVSNIVETELFNLYQVY